MKISQLTPNYKSYRFNMSNMGTTSACITPIKPDAVSFGAQQYTLAENQHIDKVDTRLYIGKKNSTANYVSAKAVVLEEGAKIKNLNLRNAVLFQPPEFEESLKKYKPKTPTACAYPDPVILMFDNSQIDTLNNKGDLTIVSFIWKNKRPLIKETVQGEKSYFKRYIYSGSEKIDKLNEINAMLCDKAQAKEINGEYVGLLDNSHADSINSKDEVCLYNQSSANNAQGKNIYINDYAHIGNATAKEVKLKGNATAGQIKGEICTLQNETHINEIKAKETYISDYSSANNVITDELYTYENSKINNAAATKIRMRNSSFIKNLSVKDELDMQDNSKVENLSVDNKDLKIDISGNAYIENLSGKDLQIHYANFINYIRNNSINNIDNLNGKNIELSGKAKVNDIKVENSLIINDGAEVNNITITGKNPEIKFIGDVKVKGKIIFENTQGNVILEKNSDGILPQIHKSQILNGSTNKEYGFKGFDKVAGMHELKEMLYDDVIKPMAKAQDYIDYGLEPINGFLLYGPPGCGKTFITRALAEETGRYFVEIPASSVVSPYLHETSQNIAQKFNEAKSHAPSIVFIDEIEALAPARDGLNEGSCAVDLNEQVTELLQQINNCKDKDILVVFASNEPQKIDNAIKRTGRIDKKIYLGPPDTETRKEMFERNLNKIKKKEANLDTQKLAELTNNYTAEDIRMVVRQAAIFALKNNKNISLDDLEQAINKTNPSLTDSLVESYKKKGQMV